MKKDWKYLTIARYKCIPNKYRICIGTWAGSPSSAIKEIENESEIGELLVRIEQEYLTSIKNGGLLKLVEEDSLLTS